MQRQCSTGTPRSAIAPSTRQSHLRQLSVHASCEQTEHAAQSSRGSQTFIMAHAGSAAGRLATLAKQFLSPSASCDHCSSCTGEGVSQARAVYGKRRPRGALRCVPRPQPAESSPSLRHSTPQLFPRLKVSPEVAAAVREGHPVVALESTIISHGWGTVGGRCIRRVHRCGWRGGHRRNLCTAGPTHMTCTFALSLSPPSPYSCAAQACPTPKTWRPPSRWRAWSGPAGRCRRRSPSLGAAAAWVRP